MNVATPAGRILTGGSPAAVAAPYLLRDTFTGTNGTALASHTMDAGAGWTVHGGTWTIQSNHLQYGGGGSFQNASADAGAADCTVSAELVADGYVGVLLRYTDEANYWWLSRRIFGDNTALFEVVAGVSTSRAAGATPSGLYTITCVLAGASITADLGGLHLSYGSAATGLSATRFGFRCFTGAQLFDNFTVTA